MEGLKVVSGVRGSWMARNEGISKDYLLMYVSRTFTLPDLEVCFFWNDFGYHTRVFGSAVTERYAGLTLHCTPATRAGPTYVYLFD
jgi:hypothetical protein